MAAALQNARDVGGLATPDGRRVRHGVLYRSDAPLAGDAPPRLDPWPPQHVVDLRSVGESIDGHPLSTPATTVSARPLYPRLNMLASPSAEEIAALTLTGLYADLLQDGAAVIAEVAGLVAGSVGPVLVHCTAGKDRTGVVVAVLLAAAGVAREDIVRDYARSASAVPGIVARMAISAPDHLMGTPEAAIAVVLDALASRPRGARGWLADNGLSPAVLNDLEQRLLESPNRGA